MKKCSLYLFVLCFLLAVSVASAEERTALVVGNGAYKESVLKNPTNDARDIAEELKKSGFKETKLLLDGTKQQMEAAIDDFESALRKRGGVGLFYYAGHGMQGPDKSNYLVPVDAVIKSPADVGYRAVSANWVLEKMQAAGSVTNIIILDSCRNNPFSRGFRGTSPGLAAMQPAKGAYILYATSPSKEAWDGGDSRNGVFTKHLLLQMTTPGLALELLAKKVADGVAKETKGEQTPWVEGMILGDFSFSGAGGNAREEVRQQSMIPPSGPDPEAEMWGLVKGTSDMTDVDRFLQKYPSGKYTDSARLLRDQLARRNKPVAATAAAPTAPVVDKPGTVVSGTTYSPAKTYTDQTTRMEFVLVPGGCFQMGDTFGDNENANEKPVHEVCVDSFYMGKYEVTQGEYQKITGSNPSSFKKGDRYPVENVSWYDANSFIKKLNEKSIVSHRLPSEAEWEYAAREGGKKVRFGTGKDSLGPDEASFNASESYKKLYSKAGKYRQETVAVGSFPSNGLGLYDMSGNVREWCWDWFDSGYYKSSERNNPNGPVSGSYRVDRGGGWHDGPGYSRAALRYFNSPNDEDDFLGFRLAFSVQ